MSKLNNFKFFQENESKYTNVSTNVFDSMFEVLSQQRRLSGGEQMYYDAQLIVSMIIPQQYHGNNESV